MTRATRATPPEPWTSWAVELSACFDVAAPPEQLAAAVALLAGPARGHDEARTALAVEQLEPLGVTRTDVGLVLLEAALAPAPVAALPGAERFEPDGITRRLVVLWGLAALLARPRRDPGPWIRFAIGVAEPVALLLELLALVDDTPGAAAGPPRIGAILRACVADGVAMAALRSAGAGAMESPRRVAALRACVSEPAVLGRLVSQRGVLLDRARAALPAEAGAPGEVFLGALDDRFSRLLVSIWLRALLATMPPRAPWSLACAAEDVRAAVDYLRETRPWQSAWDVHRFHPFGAPGVLIGRVFVEAMILLALSEMGVAQEAEIHDLLGRVPEGEARYFPDWDGLPPDVDTLGLFLRLACMVEAPPRARLETWIELLDANLDEQGAVPVWLPQGPRGPKATLEGPFLGDDCTAGRLAFLLSAVRYDARRFEPVVRATLGAVMARYRHGGFEGCLHYEPSFARYLFLRLAHELAARLPDVDLELGAGRTAVELRAELVRTQRIDGGWGSPQETALALEALTLAGAAPEQRRWAMKYLGETQEPDGAWPAEPLYITPGKHGGMVPLARKELTTALCARALHFALRAG